MNQVSNGLVSVSTPREVLEVNMTILLHPSSWSDRSEDEAEYDILKMQQQDGNPTSQVKIFFYYQIMPETGIQHTCQEFIFTAKNNRFF